MAEFIDLSVSIESSPAETPDLLRTEIAFHGHEEGAETIETMFGVPRDLLRNREGWAIEEFLRFGTHNSTHVDAPWHYNSEVAGKRAETIDELPLEWFHAPGVRLDFTGRADGEVIEAGEIEAALQEEGHTLEPLDIVLIHTGCDAYLDDDDYMVRGPGVSPDATHWLHSKGVRVMGIDAWGWDRPLNLQAAEASEKGKPGIFWSAHQADLSYSQIERLTNLSALPATGFTLACFPLKIVGGSAAPARVVGIVD